MGAFMREFKEGSGRAMGYWFGKYLAIGVSIVVIKDVMDGTAERRLKAAKSRLCAIGDVISGKLTRKKDGTVYVFKVKRRGI